MSPVFERASRKLGVGWFLLIGLKFLFGFGRTSLVELIAKNLAQKAPRSSDPNAPSILLIRRNRMGDMICTLPMFLAIRRKYPKAKITVACDGLGEPIARACPFVEEVILLRSGNGVGRWVGLIEDAAELQGFDYAIAVKGGFDLRLACFARWTNAPVRIGYDSEDAEKAGARRFYTHVLDLPENLYDEHQVRTQLRLLGPLGVDTEGQALIEGEVGSETMLTIPDKSRAFADGILAKPPFSPGVPFLLFNVSSTTPIRFSKQHQIELIQRILTSTSYAVGIVSGPKQRDLAKDLVVSVSSNRVCEVSTPGPLDLAALLARASGFITPEGGAAHLASVTQTPALILWSEGPFQKWRSLCYTHLFVLPTGPDAHLDPQKVWATFEELRPLMTR